MSLKQAYLAELDKLEKNRNLKKNSGKVPMENMPYTIAYKNKSDINTFEGIFNEIFLKREEKTRARMMKMYGEEKHQFAISKEVKERNDIVKNYVKNMEKPSRDWLKEEFNRLDQLTMMVNKDI